MAEIIVLEYGDCEEVETYGGYMVIKKNDFFYLREAGFPLMACIQFSDIKTLHNYVDKEEGRYLLQNMRELKRIKNYDKAIWWLK